MKKLLGLLLLTSCAQNHDIHNLAVVNANGITITLFDTQAGAISSLKWGEVEFVDPTQHGASLQSDVFLDNQDGKELNNPTEAGSAWDGPDDTPSTSILEALTVTENSLYTLIKPALFLAPVKGVLSQDTLIAKHVTIGYRGIPNAILYNVDYIISAPHSAAAFEALTGYMPTYFNRYFVYDQNMHMQELPKNGTNSFSDLVIIQSTDDEKYAMAAIPLTPGHDIGCWGNTLATGPDATTKWNLVYYMGSITPATYSFKMVLVVGTLDQVKDSVEKINKMNTIEPKEKK